MPATYVKRKPGAQGRIKRIPQKEKKEKVIELGDSGSAAVPIELQQPLLNIFKDAFLPSPNTDIQPLLQEVKGHLFNRDFQAAFGRNDYLEAYSARWSPSRAIGYLNVFTQLQRDAKDGKPIDLHGKIVCLGGGAGAEIVALGGLLSLRPETSDGAPRQLEVVSIDMADWSPVVDKLVHNMTTPPVLGKYASAALKAAGAPLVNGDNLAVTAHHHDVLTEDFTVLNPLIQGATLVTLLFTLNELYSTSLALTQQFLLNLTSSLEVGALLLVVDSPGSYSSVALAGGDRKYPMQWLLDHTLLSLGPKGEEPVWTKIIEDEARWFRLDCRLVYPIDLEDMRFQMHLYRKTG